MSRLLAPRVRLGGMLVLLGLLCLSPLASAQERLHIVASVPDLKNLVEEIGGDRVEVETLVKAGQDPHAILAKASLLLKLKRADGLIYLGLDYEHAFLPALLEKCRNKAVRPGGKGHMNVGPRIAVLDVPTTLSRQQGAHLHPRGNPHYNLDPENGRIMAQAARDLLVSLDPAHGKDYLERWQKWDEEAQRRIAEWLEIMEPHRGRGIVCYHESWLYFQQRFGVRIIGHIEPKPGLPPTARHLLDLSRSMKQENVQTIVMEPWYNERQVASLVQKNGAHVLKLAVTCGGTRNTQRYLDWIDHVVRSMSRELAGEAGNG